MTIEFQCDGCQKILRTADDKAGRTARCPQCGKELTVPAAPDDDFRDAPPLSTHPSDFDEFTQAPPRQQRAQPVSITCPMCGEVNDDTTDRCLACGEPLDIPAAGGGLSTSFGDIWKRAWEIWTANLGINLAAIVIACAVIMSAYMAMFGMMCAGMGLGAGMLGAAGGPPEVAVIAIVVVAGCVYLALIALFFLIQVGLSRFGIENVRAQNPSLGIMFDFSGRFVPSVVVMLVYMIVSLIIFAPGTALNLFGSFQLQNQPNDPTALLVSYGGSGLSFLLSGLVTMLLWPIPYMVADRRHGLYASIIDGPRMALSHASLSALLALVHLGLLLGGILACFVGLIFSYSLGYVLFAVAYERCRRSMRNETGTPSST